MNPAVMQTHLVRLAGRLIAAVLVYVFLRQAGLYRLTALEIEGLNTLVLLLGSIYAVMFAFVIFVIWGQFSDVQTFSMREANSLKEIVRFSRYLNEDASHAIRRAVADYVQRVARQEWEALGERKKDQQTEKAFTGLMNSIVHASPVCPAEEPIYARLIDLARKAGEHREERIGKSLTQIPPTLLRLVQTIAGALLLMVFVYPFHYAGAGIACFLLVALVLFAANFVMEDTDNPFKGVCNVAPTAFTDVLY